MRRDGSDIDVRHVTDTLEALDFEVIFKKDLKAYEMTKAIREFAQDSRHERYGCTAVFVMSHGGDNNMIYGTDHNTVSVVNDIMPCFANTKAPYLKGKAKLLFFQACR